MELVRIYECLCDHTRLRLLNLLAQGPLCVCHFQEILGESQVKVSKHLRYLKARGLVEITRQANWRIYRLPTRRPRELEANLRCLQDCVQTDPHLRRDSVRLRQLRKKFTTASPLCAPVECETGCTC